MQVKRLLVLFSASVILLGLYFSFRPRTVWWTASDGVYRYQLISDGPWFGEGYEVYLQGKTEAGGKLVFHRRLLVGLDTNGIPGFVDARIDSKRNAVVIQIAYDGGVEIPISINGWKGDWRAYLAQPKTDAN